MAGLMSRVCHPALKAVSPAALFYVDFAWSGHDRRRMDARSVHCTSRSQGEVTRMGAMLPPLDTRLSTSLQVHQSLNSQYNREQTCCLPNHTRPLSAPSYQRAVFRLPVWVFLWNPALCGTCVCFFIIVNVSDSI